MRVLENGSKSSRASISLLDNLIHSHKILLLPKSAGSRKFDGQGGRIIRTVGSKANVAILNPSYTGSNSPGIHPIHYARVEGIFHGNIVSVTGDHDGVDTSERIDFLWVRWFSSKGRSMGTEGLHLLTLPPLSDTSCFGFIDPQSVVQDCHLVPKFSKENAKCQDIESSLVAPRGGDDETKAFFLNPFIFHSALQHPCDRSQKEIP
ncbi:hypothetical protein BKA70DRAFT_1125823 [Coprinopsis sp. MPI-PUGE-AT-0042]|nr:hypothetical protein BKA70DRAFT_1125823 [Coprinopsis sp. MPI-PUGE-AT-0042]